MRHPRATCPMRKGITSNLLGLIRMTDALIDHLKTRAHAAIINVTSGLAFASAVHAHL
jgi:uncharacterized oxidoreductase